MRKSGFFPRLAIVNLARNGQFYLPYLLTVIGTVAAYYIAVALASAKDLPVMTRYVYLSAFMSIGTFVIALFAIIFLTYTNRFLMKRRKKELGLYNILGLDKRNITVMLSFESLYTAIVGIGGGLALGLLLQKLVTLLLYKMMNMDAYFGFYVSGRGIALTTLLFTLILLGNLIVNLGSIHVKNPMEMLRESNAGEREPKTKRLTAILGVLSLSGGYILAVTTRSASKAVGNYFVAVFLVIIGTYCLFSALSIVLLKTLRSNKRYYYQINHFIGVSGMIYRMKRNAVGLSNICILSTMVLVMVSGTLSLYLGTEDAITNHFPGNVAINVQYDPTEEVPFQADALSVRVGETLKKDGFTPNPVYSYKWLGLMASQTGDTYEIQETYNSSSCQLCLISAQEYAKISKTTDGTREELTFYFPGGGSMIVDCIRLLGQMPAIGGAFASTLEPNWIVLKDKDTINRIFQMQRDSIGEVMNWYGFWNVDGTTEQQVDLPVQLEENLDFSDSGNFIRLRVDSAAAFGQDYYSMNGGFFFLGVFLGLLFIMATVLIIYYKQISEGYEDRERYLIMQKVGMEQRTVRRSVNSQVLVVFFAPLLVAAVHIIFNYGLMARLLTLFSLYKTSLTLWCTIGTFTVFALIYALVYCATAKVYYRIVHT